MKKDKFKDSNSMPNILEMDLSKCDASKYDWAK